MLHAIKPVSGKAYSNPVTKGARDVEYDVLSQVTRLLMQAPRQCHDVETIRAVARNNELWTVLASALVDPANLLEGEVKSGLLSLARYALKHGQLVLAGKGATDVLIDINLSVMKGLRGAGAA